MAVPVGIDEVAHLLGGFPEGGVVLPATAEDLLGKADELGGLVRYLSQARKFLGLVQEGIAAHPVLARECQPVG